MNGDLDLAKHFPTLPWDHLVYTGGAAVGRDVMKAAAANLVPATLELGGKCPAVIAADKVRDPATAAFIAGVKAIKRGRMCVTTDYVLVPEEALAAFVGLMTDAFEKGFGTDNGRSSSSGIISDAHVVRLERLVADAQAHGAEVIRIGGEMDPELRDMPFYLVVNPSADAQVMREEVFGPILPITTYKTAHEAAARIAAGPAPLGNYVFSDDPAFVDTIVETTRSGGVAVNAAVLQAAQAGLGFSGVGASGFGRHHGEEGFREFSNPRGFYERRPGGVIDLMTPPYGAGTRVLLDEHVYGPLAEVFSPAG